MAVTALLLAGASAFFACNGSVTTPGGVDETKPLNTLTTAELTSVCNDLATNYETSSTAECTLMGLMSQIVGVDCTATRAACLANPPPEADASTTECVTGLARCTATSADLAACREALMDLYNGLTCQSSLLSLLPPAACAPLATTCPAAMPSTTTDAETVGGSVDGAL